MLLVLYTVDGGRETSSYCVVCSLLVPLRFFAELCLLTFLNRYINAFLSPRQERGTDSRVTYMHLCCRVSECSFGDCGTVVVRAFLLLQSSSTCSSLPVKFDVLIDCAPWPNDVESLDAVCTHCGIVTNKFQSLAGVVCVRAQLVTLLRCATSRPSRLRTAGWLSLFFFLLCIRCTTSMYLSTTQRQENLTSVNY